MLNDFTDRAKTAIALSTSEAQLLNHRYLAPEHILLGLLKETNGVASFALRNLGVDFVSAKNKIIDLVGIGSEKVNYNDISQTPITKRLLNESQQAAIDLNDSYAGTEHILLGILRTEDNLAMHILERFGLNKQIVRSEIIRVLNITEPEKVQPASKQDLVMALAKKGHYGQKRSNGSDYINHPISVRNLLIEYGIQDEDVLNTALCHDLLEDTSITKEEIRIVAGDAVLEAVKQLTNVDPPGKKRDFFEKTQDMLEHAKHYGDIAKMVKLADRYDNLSDAIWEWNPPRVKRYAQAGLSLLDAMLPIPDKVQTLATEARRFFSCLS